MESYERIVTKGHGDAVYMWQRGDGGLDKKAVVEVERRDLSAI